MECSIEHTYITYKSSISIFDKVAALLTFFNFLKPYCLVLSRVVLNDTNSGGIGLLFSQMSQID